MIRAFVALGLDAASRAAVSAEIEVLRPLGRAVAWVPAENLHLTLKFLGSQTDDGIRAAGAALEEAAAGRAAFTAALHGVGGFPGMDRPRILWIGVAGGALAVRELQSAVEAALAQRGFEREARPWHPHLTIGRVFDPNRWRRDATPALHEAIARAATRTFGEVPVTDVLLMRSDLSRSGARYTALRSIPLEAAR